MKLESGKFYLSKDGRVYGPAKLEDTVHMHFRVYDTQCEVFYWFEEDGRLVGGSEINPRNLVCECTEQGDIVIQMKAPIFEQSNKEKQIYEMELDDYRRGIDAIWDKRHLNGA